MKAPAIVVPFKGAGYKSRLSPIMDAKERRGLALLLLADLLKTIGRAGLGKQCYVVSSDPSARQAARTAEVSFISEPRARGVNSAVRLAARKLPRRERFMVVPSDLAMLSVPELRCALEEGNEFPLVIAPSSSFNGTNLLLFPRRMAASLSYDNNSFWNHLGAAARLRLRTAVITKKGFVFDLDTPAEADQLAASRTNSRAAKFLRRRVAR